MFDKTFKSMRMLLIAAGLSVMLAACGGNAPAATPTTAPTTTEATPASGDTGTTSGGDADAAIAAVKGFFDSVYAVGDKKPADFVCTSNATAEQMASSYEQAAAAYANAKFDTSGLTFTAKDMTADKGTVVVGGKVTFDVAGTPQEVPFTDVPILVGKEGDAWKVFCAA